MSAQRSAIPDLVVAVNPNACLPDAGSRGWCGDSGPATQARLAGPRDVAPLTGGGYLIADTLNHVVRRVDGDRVITTVAGIGAAGSTGDGGPASEATLDTPTGVEPHGDGFLIADPAAHVVRRVSADGTIRRLAGTGRAAASADGGPATRAALRAPRSVVVLPDGAVLVADADDHRVRRIAPDGTISTFAGTGRRGTAGDGGPATAALLQEPVQLAAEPGGGLLIVDREAGRVRRVAPDGRITTVAGGGTPQTPATALRLQYPNGVASTEDGGFLVTEAALVRQVMPDGSVRQVAGTGTEGFNGDRSLALRTQLRVPASVAWLGAGDVLLADGASDRVRRFNLLGGIRTVAGFDRPDQVLGAPAEPAVAATVRQRRAAACAERSRPGRFNVLRIRPSDPKNLRVGRRGTITLLVESSARARVRLTVHPRGSGVRSVRLVVLPAQRTSIRLRARRRGTYRLRVTGTLAARPAATRCAERRLRVG